jgi:hypothetical protein
MKCPTCGSVKGVSDLWSLSKSNLAVLLGDLLDLKALKRIREHDPQKSYYYEEIGDQMSKKGLIAIITKIQELKESKG